LLGTYPAVPTIRGPVHGLFGDAGSATAIEVDESADPMHFDLHSDGSGDVIIIPGGGAHT
jgi:3-oxoacyl-[acyl-carrier-protein] synthase III